MKLKIGFSKNINSKMNTKNKHTNFSYADVTSFVESYMLIFVFSK